MIHAFVIRRGNQTRGVPFFVSAMSRMNMLGGYEEAELAAARMAACKMGFFVSKTGEEYTGKRNATSGAVETVVEPGTMDQLPEGVDVKVVDWQHPSNNFENFVQQMVRGMAVGLDVSYASLAGDLRQVNFSSIRQGTLDERDAWRALQTFAIDHICRPIYADFVVMALLSRRLALPASGLDDYVNGVVFQARGWTWVDPLKDVEADLAALGGCLTTLADVCAARGKDWRDVVDQQAVEFAYAKKKGIDLNYSRPKPASIGTQPEEQPAPAMPGEPLDDSSDQQSLRLGDGRVQ
jgi:lambda family phage portal protein